MEKERKNKQRKDRNRTSQTGWFLTCLYLYHCWALSGTTHSHQQAALPLFPFSLSLEFLPALPALLGQLVIPHTLSPSPFLSFLPSSFPFSLSLSFPPSYNPRFDCLFQFPLFLLSLPVCLSFSFLPIATAIDLVRLIPGDTQPKP